MRVCTLMSGSSGNAIFVETKGARVLIDAGQSGRNITRSLQEGCNVHMKDLDAILITHAHRDHVTGAGVLCRRHCLPVYATAGAWREMEPLIGPVPPKLQNVINPDKTWQLGDIKIEPFPVSHDALEPVGFILSSGDKTVGIATDSGVFTTRMGRALQNLDCLILEANHDPEMLRTGPYPWPLKKRIAGDLGHLSNEGAGKALLNTLGERTKSVILAHLSEENNRPFLALETVTSILEKNRVMLQNVSIEVAPRYQPGRCVSF